MIIKPKIRGFICTTAHPEGCKALVKNEIEYVKAQKHSNGPKKVLVIGASMGYGLASRISAAYSYGAATLGVIFDKPASGSRTATSGWYNTAAFEQFAAQDPELNNLIREYHDGLLLYEISNRNVWDKAAKDEKALAAYFQKHKKDYKWESPRFKGIAYHVKDKKDVKAVKKCIKNIPFDQWAEKLRTTFNADSVLRIRVEKGLFKPGDNALVDREVFGRSTTVTPTPDFPIDATFGKVLKAPKEYTDVKGQVTADYQDQLEREWVAELRKRYPVVINQAVLETVNNHQ